MEYKLPKENQVWIINDLIPNDEKNISDLNHANIFYLILTSFIGKPEIKVAPEKHEIKTEPITNSKRYAYDIKNEEILISKSNKPDIKKEEIKNSKSAEIKRYPNLHNSDDFQWSCERCTFLNRPKCKICQMCNTKKTGQDFNFEKNIFLKQRNHSLIDLFDDEDMMMKKKTIFCNNCHFGNSIDKPICALCLSLLPSQKEQTTDNNFKKLNRQNSKSLTNLNKKYKSVGNLNKSEDDSSDDEKIFGWKN